MSTFRSIIEADATSRNMERKLKALLDIFDIEYKIEQKATGSNTFKFDDYKISVGGVFVNQYTLFKDNKEIKAQITYQEIEDFLRDTFR